MTMGYIYGSYFRQDSITEELFNELWEETARALQIPANKLRPTDRFDRELSVRFFPLVDLNEDLVEVLLDRIRGKGVEARKIKIRTVGEYIQLLATVQGLQDNSVMEKTHQIEIEKDK